MNAWKVIVPTLVIFIAGIVTGLVLDKFVGQRPAKPAAAINQQGANPWLFKNRELLKRMDRELDLTSEQHKRIVSDMVDSQKRIRFELQQLHQAIAKELTPEQRKKFEALTRPRMMEKRRNSTNSLTGTEELTPEEQKKFEDLTRQRLMEKRRNSTNSPLNTNIVSTNTLSTNAPATP